MQLDKTQISIRERSQLEILDLSLHVTRAYALPLLVTFALGAVPAMIVNHLLIGWMADIIYDDQFPFAFMWNMAVLVVIEAPLASIFATCYLGQAVFQERPSIRQVVIDVLRLGVNIGICQLIIRAVAPICILYLFTRSQIEWAPLAFFLIHVLAVIALVVRCARPFINEIIVLERNPLRARDPGTQTIALRSSRLHGPAAGDLLARWLAAAVIAVLLWAAFYGVFLFASGVLFNDWRQGAWAVGLCHPLAMWMVAFFFTVVRFLSYLDTRIRQEGWEVELKLRAEAAKLASKLA